MAKKWQILDRIIHLQSRWVTVYADRLQDDQGRELEYWHYERPDSVIVIAIQGDQFLLPAPQYRVGVGEIMLDFAGSRLASGQTPEAAARAVLRKELGLAPRAITRLQLLTPAPLAVDSSFSSQRLHGYVAHIATGAKLAPGVQTFAQPNPAALLQALHCGQCRLLLHEYLLMR